MLKPGVKGRECWPIKSQLFCYKYFSWISLRWRWWWWQWWWWWWWWIGLSSHNFSATSISQGLSWILWFLNFGSWHPEILAQILSKPTHYVPPQVLHKKAHCSRKLRKTNVSSVAHFSNLLTGGSYVLSVICQAGSDACFLHLRKSMLKMIFLCTIVVLCWYQCCHFWTSPIKLLEIFL